MRQIKYIVLHCTATSHKATISSIKNYWKNGLGWKNPGYHYIIKADGSYEQLASLETVCNGVAGYNSNSIHISYIGGVDSAGKAVDNRTEEQKDTLIRLLKELKQRFPTAQILGHRDFPGVKKDCPSFSVKQWLATIKL